MSIIIYDNVSVKIDGSYLFKDFNLSLEDKEKVILYGHSGIGKTTLFKLLLGYSRPDEGKIYFNGKELDDNLIWDIRKKVSYVPQNLDLSDEIVITFIDKIFSYKNNKSSEYNRYNLISYLNKFNLSENILKKNFQKLSGGEKQRIAIIISILLNRDIYLLDEVTSSLDKDLKDKVIDFYTKDVDKLVIIISHDSNWLKASNIRKVDIKGENIGS